MVQLGFKPEVGQTIWNQFQAAICEHDEVGFEHKYDMTKMGADVLGGFSSDSFHPVMKYVAHWVWESPQCTDAALGDYEVWKRYLDLMGIDGQKIPWFFYKCRKMRQRGWERHSERELLVWQMIQLSKQNGHRRTRTGRGISEPNDLTVVEVPVHQRWCRCSIM